jgi:hypothetical protein
MKEQRLCSDCGTSVNNDANICPKCNRFVPGGKPAVFESPFVACLIALVTMGLIVPPNVKLKAWHIVFVLSVLGLLIGSLLIFHHLYE